MNQLITQIQLLCRDEAIEAALSLSQLLVTDDFDEKVAAEQADALIPGITDNPYVHIEATERLARIILVNAADSSPENYQMVEKIISGTGKKQVIFTGIEIVALAAISLAALKIILNPVSHHKITFRDKDGTEITEETTRDPNMGFLRSIFEKLIK